MSDALTSEPVVHEELPLFPLRTVLYPDGLLELKIFETRYLDMMSSCMRTRRPFGVVALRTGTEAKVSDAPVSLHDAGTLVELLEVDSAQVGILRVRARGTHRFVLEAPAQRPGGLWVGKATERPDDPVVAPGPAHARIVKSLADAVAAMANEHARPFLEPYRFDDAGWVANRWCEMLPLALEAKQRLLLLDDPLGRLEIVDLFMRQQPDLH